MSSDPYLTSHPLSVGHTNTDGQYACAHIVVWMQHASRRRAPPSKKKKKIEHAWLDIDMDLAVDKR